MMDKAVKKPHGEALRKNSNNPFQYLAWQKAMNPVKFMFDQSGGKKENVTCLRSKCFVCLLSDTVG